MGYETKHPRIVVLLASTENYVGCVFGLLIAFGIGIFAGHQECHVFDPGEIRNRVFPWRRWIVIVFEIIDIICMIVGGRIGRSAITFKRGQCQQRFLRTFFALNVVGLVISVADIIFTVCVLLKLQTGMTGNIWIIDSQSDFFVPATVMFFLFIVMKMGIQGAAAFFSHDCVTHRWSRSDTLLDIRQSPSVKTFRGPDIPLRSYAAVQKPCEPPTI